MHSRCCELPRSKQIIHINHLRLTVTHFTPGWRGANMVKCLAQGHKCYDRDSNPHPDDLTARTWVRCSYLLDHDIPGQLWVVINFSKFRMKKKNVTWSSEICLCLQVWMYCKMYNTTPKYQTPEVLAAAKKGDSFLLLLSHLMARSNIKEKCHEDIYLSTKLKT